MASITQYREFQPAALKGVLDASIEQNEPTFADEFVGNEVSYDIRFAYDIIQRKQHIAAMIGLGAEKPVIDRHGAASRMVELAHFGLKDIVTIEELYEINAARNDADRQNRINRLLNRSVDLVNYLQLRKRVEKIKAVAFGSNTYDKNGVKIELDYGVPEDHKIALTSGNDWSDLDRDIIGDLIGWVETYKKNNAGKAPEAALVSRKVFGQLALNRTLIAEAGRPETATRISEAELNEVLGRYGIPAIKVVEETTFTVNDIYTGEDETIEVFPENRVVFIAKGVGNFITGPNPDAPNMEPIATLEAYNERTPRRDIIEVAESGFVVLDNPSLLLHADVIEPTETVEEPVTETTP